MESMLARRVTLLSVMLFALLVKTGYADDPKYWAFTPTPPMGWNSYDAFGDSVTEDETMANAQYMKSAKTGTGIFNFNET